jgi:D-alanyl-D-alanine carboxypeptidase (penicillin-binding protein 5/6)
MKQWIACLLAVIMGTVPYGDGISLETAANPDLNLSCEAAVLMEASTGQILYEKNSDTALSPASITKIMTLLLIFDAIADGKIHLDDVVTTSAYAKSMGGSQVFLEEGEEQTVETLIKCIIVASGNDASVAMAEYICGSETEFVAKMNERAKELGMEQTHFVDCCGLTDSDEHYVSAKDVAIMARELTVNYPEIFTYAGIWMENITHVTKQGTKEFGLTNTNKLLKQYSYATGLKTGSTSKAKYCLAGTASKDGVDLIAVVMAAPDNKARFSEAITMFQYGFANCNVYQDLGEAVYEIPVEGGMTEAVEARLYQPFSYLSTEGADLTDVTSTIEYDTVQAPVFAGDVVGTITYKAGDTVLGQEKLVATADVAAKGYGDFLKESIGRYFLGTW